MAGWTRVRVASVLGQKSKGRIGVRPGPRWNSRSQKEADIPESLQDEAELSGSVRRGEKDNVSGWYRRARVFIIAIWPSLPTTAVDHPAAVAPHRWCWIPHIWCVFAASITQLRAEENQENTMDGPKKRRRRTEGRPGVEVLVAAKQDQETRLLLGETGGRGQEQPKKSGQLEILGLTRDVRGRSGRVDA